MERFEPDRAAIEYVYGHLHMLTPLDEVLKNPTLNIVINAVARRHMERRAKVDVKKLQANDNEEPV